MKRFVGFAVRLMYTGITYYSGQTANFLKNTVVGFIFAPGITICQITAYISTAN